VCPPDLLTAKRGYNKYENYAPIKPEQGGFPFKAPPDHRLRRCRLASSRNIVDLYGGIYFSGCSRSNRLRSRPARAKQMP
jgi:hypothetical protein